MRRPSFFADNISANNETYGRPALHTARRLFTTSAPACFLALVVLTGLFGPSPIVGQDEGDAVRSRSLFDLDHFRFYADFRYGSAWSVGELVDGIAISGQTDALDGGFGFDLGPLASIELRLNLYEFTVSNEERGRFGEFSANAFVPRLRLRYPMGNGRFVPRIAGGVGVAVSQFNDATPAAGKPEFIQARTTTSLAWNVGTGFDWFVARNMALGLEASYQATSRGATIDSLPVTLDSKAVILSLGLTYFIPERAPEGLFRGVSWGEPDRHGFRPYLTIRAGTKQRLDSSFGAETTWRHGEALNAGGFGFDLNRRFAVELAVENHDGVIDGDPYRVAEYATWMYLPRVRVKLPDWSDTWVPYLVAGVGLGTSQVNDPTFLNQPDMREVIAGSSESLAGSFGAGLDIHSFGNMSFVIETTYLAYNSTIMEGDGELDLADSSIHVSGGFRFYFK